MTGFNDLPELEDNECSDYSAVDLKGSGINVPDLIRGKETCFEVDPTSVDPVSEEVNSYFDQEELFKQLNFECLDEGDDSGDERMTPFSRMRLDMTVLTENGGVMKKIIKQGAGSIVPPRSLCRVHYNAYLEYSDEPFDSSRLRGRQTQFKLGEGGALPGWEIGVATMKRGELARFMFEYQYAYGKMGCPPRIPKEAAVLFEIELISYVDQEASDDFENFSEEERKQLSFDEMLKVADCLRVTGNEAFQLKQIGRASGKYSQALRLLENTNLADEKEEAIMKKSALKLYLNLSLCGLKQAKYGRSCKYARKALDVEPKNIKALYRLAQSLRKLSEYEDAKRQIAKAHRIDPGNKDVMQELHALDEEMKKTKKHDKDLCRKMLNLKTGVKQPVEAKVKAPNQMLSMITDRMKTFLEEKDMPYLPLPTSLTEEEIVCVEEAAKQMNLHVHRSNQDGLTSLRVSKIAKDVK
ncbi:inactive peptidyl-prolyl cis-trans isomerase FKBP6-like isoform X2 [Hydractinia symbiolongicarpus]|uniref:inactive peptidyl-prolyl cis-trans isomerase FKBP6-like isoform X2 n=1 Tax=Hydractinia symbiolongicarpus TaxID=13093 RepID=UPI0025518EBC|nr:inactive peptidyl-prolyl cis-trans isomerase FKBP6-like isoform X2 [Hydractinia symbiolongicarpus]